MVTTLLPQSSESNLQVDAETRNKPKILFRLSDWQYVERSIHRLLAGWGRHFSEWDDKSAVHRHIWDQAECVRRLRERISQFVGGKPDADVSGALEELANTVLLAPSFEDAVDGIYAHLSHALVKSYMEYAITTNPIHDAPTVAMLHEICTIKEQHRLWYHDYRRRIPHTTDVGYLAAVNQALANCKNFAEALPVTGDPAKPAGVATEFRPRRFGNRPDRWHQTHNIVPYIRADFQTQLETRRLFWAYAYMLEKSLPDDQLVWLYWGHYMPWDFQYEISRHLWDESRHGDSGLSRLKDFGIEIEEIGFPSYDLMADGTRDQSLGDPVSPSELYDKVFFIGMVAETAHFEVKNEAYADFRDGGDLESAEMMLFDVIDETMHVQYAHRWLPVLAEKASRDNSNYKKLSVEVRASLAAEMQRFISEDGPKLDRSPENADYQFYLKMLDRARAAKPLSNAATCPPRKHLPM